eukprot:scaffold4455_cov143-Skeletonema_menzelii.AAC.4
MMAPEARYRNQKLLECLLSLASSQILEMIPRYCVVGVTHFHSTFSQCSYFLRTIQQLFTSQVSPSQATTDTYLRVSLPT